MLVKGGEMVERTMWRISWYCRCFAEQLRGEEYHFGAARAASGVRRSSRERDGPQVGVAPSGSVVEEDVKRENRRARVAVR